MYNNQFILQSLSCIARRHQVVLVANMGEKVPCSSSDPHCPSDGRYQYETTVVFESDGRFVTKYRKFNVIKLEREELDAPPFPQHAPGSAVLLTTLHLSMHSHHAVEG